jgi:hypothetical protein
LYTNDSLFYRIINKAFSDMDNKNIEIVGKWIKALKLALEIFDDKETFKEIVLYRGANVQLDFSVNDNYKIMQHIIFPPFTSTSTSKEIAEGFKRPDECFILFKISYQIKLNRDKYRPKSLKAISSLPSECEYLLGPFSKFNVQKVNCINERLYMIEINNLD